MRKEGFRGVFNSRDARVNIMLFAAILVIFALTMVFVEAMTVVLRTPGNLTYNASPNRNINFSFNSTWFHGGADPQVHENISNCSLWVNSTERAIKWEAVKNISIDKIGANNPDDFLSNGSNSSGAAGSTWSNLSYMNWTFPADGNYTYGVGCYNFTNATTAVARLTFSGNFTFFIDASGPTFNFTSTDFNGTAYNTTNLGVRSINFSMNDSGYGVNLTYNGSINFSVYLGGTKIAFYNYTNSSAATNLTCSALSPVVTTGIITCNASFNFNSNGTYIINASAQDALGTYGIAEMKVTVDQIPPVIKSLNFTNSSSPVVAERQFLGGNTPSTVPAVGVGTFVQNKPLFAIANVTDNLTVAVHAYLQFYNVSSSTWIIVNSTPNAGYNFSPFSEANVNDSINLSYIVPAGHNVFEGANVSFRLLINDTLGNINTSGNVVNVTIQINDTSKPDLVIRLVDASGTTNFTNTTNTTPTVFWNVTEGNNLKWLAIQFNSLTESDCGFKNFTSVATATTNKNGTLNLFTAAGCPTLANGTNTVRFTAEDSWGNGELYIHSFEVDTGGPNITFNNTQHGIAPVFNLTNVTPYTGINITVVGVGQAAIKNISFTSSCNSTVQTITNGTFIWPFNYSSGTCKDGVFGNRTVTIQAYDIVGNSQTKTFTFTVDDLGPSLSVASPVHRSNNSNNVTITLSAKDGSQAIAFFGYYLDRKMDVGTLTNLNLTTALPWIGATGANITNTFRLNFTPGTHHIKFTVNDTLGNAINSSIITFDVRGVIDLDAIGLNVTNKTGSNLAQYHYANAANVSIVNLTNASSGRTVEEMLNISGDTLNLFLDFDNITKSINLTITFNESAAIWDQYNFTVQTNDSTVLNFLTSNWTTPVNNIIIINETIQNFLPDNNSYYVTVTYPINVSGGGGVGGTFEIWYFDDVKFFSDSSAKKNLSECAAGFNPSFTFNRDSACWNNTDNYSINVYLPHFSALAFVNNSVGDVTPNVNVTTPLKANQTVSMFIPNITVSADAVSCYYHLNTSTTTATTNKTMAKSGNICLGDTERLKNLSGSPSYNATFWVIDDDGNTNKYVWEFNLSDSTQPNNPNSTTISTSVDSTTATITISGINETVNATVFYATTVSGISASTSAVQTDFNQSQAVSLDSLTASQLYHFNVTICDFNGNCARNGTFNFTTSAAVAAAAAASSSSSGGGGGGAVAPSNVAASTGTSWDTLAAGSTGTVKVNNEKIAVTSIVIEVANTVTSPSVNVQSLTSNPLTTSAAAKVYQYLQITRGNIADSDTSKIKISFKVPKSWLTSNNVGENDVVLYRYADSKWNGLPTSKTGDDGTNILYDSTTPGFSTFAVGSREAAPVVTPPTEAPIVPPTEQPPAEAPTAAEPVTPAAPEEKKGLSSTTMAWVVVLVIVVVAGIGYFVWQKKKEE